MRVEFTGRHIENTPALRRLIERKLGRLERMLNDSAVSAQVVLRYERRACRAYITLHARGERFLHGVGDSTRWETSIRQAVDRIAQQAEGIKGKWQVRRRRAHPRIATELPAGLAEPARARQDRDSRADGGRQAQGAWLARPVILRTASQPLKAMSVAQAAREFRAGDDGVVIFRDTDTSAVSVLIRRSNGELTLVATDA
jgi:putative sigma-54 modulation protein